MNTHSRIAFAAAFAGTLLLATSARADDFKERMKVTFSGPVEIPGKVLPAGTSHLRLG